MSVAQLNVEIGARISSLSQGLRQAEREMRKFGQGMASLGNQLSLAITLPLAGIGAAAIKTAGEMEALRLAMRATFEGAGRSIAEADAELEALRQSAKAPGLDFEQAVRGSVRLQNVGFSAETARTTIEQLANTIATTGGTAEDLNEVVNQFSQMIGKGKLFQDDLKIITGRMPKVAQLMKESFGTTTAEGLNKLGINAREFVDVITKKMAELPRVSGGVSNSIVNAFSSVRQSLATLGESLNKTFNVTGRLDQFAAWIEGVAQGFAGLSDDTQRAILGVAVFVAAIGPAIRVSGLMVQGVMAMRNAFASLRIAMLAIEGGGLIGWWRTLNTVMKANVIGVAVGAAIALAAAYAALSKDMSAAAQASRAVEKASQEAANSIVVEKTNVGLLVDVLKDENASREEKRKALATLKAISPEYFGQLSTEKSKIEDIVKAQDAYIANMLRTAKAQAAFQQIQELEKQRNNLAETSDPTIWQDLASALKSGGSAAAFFADRAKSAGKNVIETNATIDAQIKALTGVVRANGDFVATVGSAATGTKNFTDANDKSTEKVKEAQIEYDGATRRIRQMADAMLQLRSVQDAFRVASPLAALPSGGSQGDTESGVALKPVESLTAANEQLARTQQILAGLKAAAGDTVKPISTMALAIDTAARAMYDAAASGEASFGKLAGAAVASAAKVVRAWIQQGVAAAVSRTLAFIPPPFNIAAGFAVGALAAGLFNKVLNGLKVPGFAQGTSNAPGGLAMVGERGPELVSLPRASQVVPNPKLRSLAGGGDVNVSGTFRVRGSDLLLVLEREQKQAQRTRGY